MPRTDAWSLLNLLPNFELIAGRKDGNGMTTPYLQRLDNTTVTMPCSEAYDGFNSAYIANASTATVYPGVYFLNVHVKKNTDYVVGVWLNGGKGNVVVLEVCRQSAVESRPGTGRASDAQFVNYVTIEKDNEWEYHEMTVNSGAYELIEVNYWIGTNGQSAYIAKPSLQESRKGDKGDPGKQGEQGKSATSYRLQLKSGTEAKVVTNGSGDDVKFTLSAIIYYLVIKNTGGSDTEVTDAKFVATIEGKDRTVLYNTKTNKGYYLEYTGTTAYTATNTPQSAIPLTVTLADGTVLNDSIPVTIQPGVAVDINNKIGKLTTTVAGKADISTLEQTAGRISAKVASLGLRNLLMDSEFRCPVEKTIKRGGKKYREAWNNGTSVTVTDTANGISAEGVNAVKATSAVSDGYWTVTRWYVPAKSGQVYTASAWCMVPDVSVLTGDSCCYLQLFACKDDLSRSNDSKAYAYFKGLSSGEWKRDTCSLIMPKDTAYTYIEVALAAFRCGTVYFRQPQLELGSEATEWTRCADDVEGGLLATGIDIYNNRVDVTADNFTVKNNKGEMVIGTDADKNFYVTGTIRAKNLFHNVCVWGYSKDAYYYLDTDKKYYNSTEYDDMVYSDHSTHEPGDFEKCSGPADIVIIPFAYEMTTKEKQSVRTVVLPDANDFEGKMIEVVDTNYNKTENFYVKSVNGGWFSVGIYCSGDKIDPDSGLQSVTFNSLDTARFVSIRSSIVPSGYQGTSYCYWFVIRNN